MLLKYYNYYFNGLSLLVFSLISIIIIFFFEHNNELEQHLHNILLLMIHVGILIGN